MSTRDAIKRAAAAEPVRRVVSAKATRSVNPDICEECEQEYDTGTWVLRVTTGSYVNFIHETCPPMEDRFVQNL